jgi:hypothetical protein
MQIDEDYFRSILRETIDENPLASRAVLSLCGVEFTDEVKTLSVSLGKPSALRVNLEFLRTHCQTEKHVKAVLIHEFLHILLGHTVKFKKMTPALNVALDAIINAIIHRKLGQEYSSLMANYYAEAQGLLRLLRPITTEEIHQYNYSEWHKLPTDPLLRLHDEVYSGKALADDVFSIAQSFAKKEVESLLAGGLVLLGDHDRDPSEIGELDEAGQRRFKQSLVALDANGIFRNENGLKPQRLSPHPRQLKIPATWRRDTLPVLQRLIVPDPSSRLRVPETRTHLAPVLNTSDRRGAIKALWSPLIPEIAWDAAHPHPAGSVQIYLDVSGSMNRFLDALVALLAEFSSHIRKPLWAFSTEVHPARILRGKLETKTTGGTAMDCVYRHIRQTRPAKALIITDGFVEESSAAANPHELCRIEAIIPHDGHDATLLKHHKIPTTRLTKLPASALLASSIRTLKTS